MEEHTILFEDTDKGAWLRKIAEVVQLYHYNGNHRKITIDFLDKIKAEELYPIHLVTLACLIQYLSDNNWLVYGIKGENKEVGKFLFDDLKFDRYWSGGQNHVETNKSYNIFNLWRIVDSEKDIYAKSVEDYFKRNYFQSKDLSPISIALLEAYYNVLIMPMLTIMHFL